MAMPHITSQSLLAETTQIGHGHAIELGKLKRDRKNEKLNSSGVQSGLRDFSAKALLAIPNGGSTLNRSPPTQNLNFFPNPTPTSSISAVFDSPHKSSPSSSISSTNHLAVVQRAQTPLAELEDTSLTSLCLELEDTSNYAVRSLDDRELSPSPLKSTHLTARSLVSAVDQRFSDYESEIRLLRKSLAEVEKALRETRKSLREAREAAEDSFHALGAAQEVTTGREYEIKASRRVIAELEKEIKHCQKHHPPPTPPAKWWGSDGAISRFNTDLNRSPKSLESRNSPTNVPPSLIGHSFAASPKFGSEGTSTMTPPKSPRSNLLAPSPGAPSPSTGGSPSPQCYYRSQNSKYKTHIPLTAEALAASLSSAAGPSKTLVEATESHCPRGGHIRKISLERPIMLISDDSSGSTVCRSRHHSRRAIQSSVSTPSLRETQNAFLWRNAPDLPPPPLPIMSGGLGIIESPMNGIQDHKLRKKCGALGDLFRRKDQGAATGDDMTIVRRRDQGSTAIMSNMVNALEFYGI